MSCGSDDDNRIRLTELPSELTGEEEGSDYINAYVGDYINASYIDVRVTTLWNKTPCVIGICSVDAT